MERTHDITTASAKITNTASIKPTFRAQQNSSNLGCGARNADPEESTYLIRTSSDNHVSIVIC